MFGFPRRSRPRRLSRDLDAANSAPAARRRALRALLPHIIIGGVFLALSVLILTIGATPLPLRVGERASFDILSRVPFSFEDKQATRNAEREAVLRTAHVYTFDQERFDALAAGLPEALKGIVEPQESSPDDNPALRSIELSDEEIAAIRAALAPPRNRETVWFLKDVLIELEGLVFLSNDRYEIEKGRDRIDVRRTDGREFIPVVLVRPEREIEKVLHAAGDPRRLRAREISSVFYQALVKILTPNLKGLCEYDVDATQLAFAQAREGVEPVTISRSRGEILVKRDGIITEKHLLLLQKEEEEYSLRHRGDKPYGQVVGLTLFVSIMLLVCAVSAARSVRPARATVKHWSAALLVLLALLMARLVLEQRWSPYVIPLGFVSAVLAIAYGEGMALAASVPAVVLIAVLFGNNFVVGITYFLGSAVAVIGSRHIGNRVRLMLVGVAVGVVQFLAIFSFGLIANSDPLLLFWEASWGLAGGLAAGLLATGLLPFLERIFNVSTSIGLLELSDLNSPLMKKLALLAPGTYNHSVIVGHLAESAAKAVGADALLARVASFYHDIGKMSKPEYFVENRSSAESKHTRLSPTMSALVIMAHTKDGLELAEDHKLPGSIREIIAQHHGTTVVQYFYEQARQAGGEEEPNQDAFRYPGPKAQSKEAAIVMLADAVESASRTLSEPTPARVEALVRRISEARLRDGQLDECDLTLRDLKKIGDELTRTLSSMFHARVVYPSSGT